MARALTSTQLCRLLDISTKTLYLWERSGKIRPAGRDRRGWRTFSPSQVEAIRRFAGRGDTEAAPAERRPAKGRGRRDRAALPALTARNQIRGTVVSVASDGLLAEVVLRLPDGQEIVSVVTRASIQRLGIRRGQEATAVIKATEVMLLA